MKLLLVLIACCLVAARPASADEGRSRCPDPAQAEGKLGFGAKVDARAVTGILPGGYEGLLIVRSPLENVEDIAVYHSDSLVFDRTAVPVTLVSARKAVDDPKLPEYVAGFGSKDSTLLQFEVPSSDVTSWPPWPSHGFTALICKSKGLITWAQVQVRVSRYSFCLAIVCIALGLAYLLIAIGVGRTRNRNVGSEAAKALYPSYTVIRKVSFWHLLNPVVLTADAFNRGSLQKLQILLFSFIVSGMLAMLSLRVGILSDLSATVAMLLGISGVGAAAAQATATSTTRLDFENWAWLVARGVLPLDQGADYEPKWSDLVTTGREFDVYKFQTLIFALVVAVALLTAGTSRLSAFEVPPTLLGILGLSQIVYIGGILVKPPTIQDLNATLTKLRQKEAVLNRAIDAATDTDEKDQLITPEDLAKLSDPSRAAAVDSRRAKADYQGLADQVAIMLSSIFEKVDPEKLKFRRRTVAAA